MNHNPAGLPLGMIVLVMLVGVLIYALPTVIAGFRHHPYGWPIAVVNVFLGWSLVGWAVSLAWAVMPIDRPDSPTYARRRPRHRGREGADLEDAPVIRKPDENPFAF